jgi:hypothetical protein
MVLSDMVRGCVCGCVEELWLFFFSISSRVHRCMYLLIDFFDDSAKNSTSTQRPNFEVF